MTPEIIKLILINFLINLEGSKFDLKNGIDDLCSDLDQFENNWKASNTQIYKQQK